MASRSIGLITGDAAGERTAAAIPNEGLSGRVSIAKPFKAVFQAMLRIGEDFAEAQEMARQTQRKSPRLRSGFSAPHERLARCQLLAVTTGRRRTSGR